MNAIQISPPVMDMIFDAVDEGIGMLREANFVLFALLMTKGGVVLRRFADEDVASALERARTTLRAVDRSTYAYALVYDATILLDGVECDALLLETGERGKARGWRFAQRYQVPSSPVPLWKVGDLAFLGTMESYFEL